MKLEDLITLKAAAELMGCRRSALSRLAKKGGVPGAINVLGRWGFDPAALENFEMPVSQVRTAFGPKRKDGRWAHKIFLTEVEAITLTEAGYEVIDLKAARIARKAAKKAKLAAEGVTSTAAQQGYDGVATVAAPETVEDPNDEDPFAAFGTD